MDKQGKLGNRHIVIMAGGTGGHIFPALAIAEKAQEEGAGISWLGTRYGLETKLVSGDYPLDYLSVSGVRKKGGLRKLMLPFSLTKAILQAMIILKKRKADLVIGFGGYVSGPGGIAAKLLGIPLMIHEQNARAGLTNKVLAKLARKVLCAFPANSFAGWEKSAIVGNPVRREICDLHDRSHDFYKKYLNVLVLGGSQGAKALNEIIPCVLSALSETVQVNLWHQTGQNSHREVLALYRQHGLMPNQETGKQGLKVVAFIEEMASAYHWADVVVCRSGALTVSELAVAGLPAFFVPFPYAVDNHQYYNAQFLVKAGAAVCVEQKDLSVKKLAGFIKKMHVDRAGLSAMSEKAKSTAFLQATEAVMKYIKREFDGW